MAHGKFKIEKSAFIAVDVALGEYAYIVQADSESRDQITLDKQQAAHLADLLAAWAHTAAPKDTPNA